jgi:hypothetical protein
MKRGLFIAGIIVILILVGVLIFLLTADDETKAEIFSNFNFTGKEEGVGVAIMDFLNPDENPTNVAALRQLSLKPTIGLVEAAQDASSTSPTLYFAEAGTGHVFSLDVVAGTETRLSNITIPQSEKAAIAPDGSTAVIGSDLNQAGYKLTVILLPQNGSNLESFEIVERVKDFSITMDNVLFYSVTSDGSLLGKRYNIKERTSASIFKLPFNEATILWGKTSDSPIYTHPKPSLRLEGYLYEIKDGSLRRLPVSGFGLSSKAGVGSILSSVKSTTGYASSLYQSDGSVTSLSTGVMPEKCDLDVDATLLICGNDTNAEAGLLPDKWYQGAMTLNDDIIVIDTASGAQFESVSPKLISGRELDIVYPLISADEQRFYFINKNDQSPWLLDRTLITQP